MIVQLCIQTAVLISSQKSRHTSAVAQALLLLLRNTLVHIPARAQIRTLMEQLLELAREHLRLYGSQARSANVFLASHTRSDGGC